MASDTKQLSMSTQVLSRKTTLIICRLSSVSCGSWLGATKIPHVSCSARDSERMGGLDISRRDAGNTCKNRAYAGHVELRRAVEAVDSVLFLLDIRELGVAPAAEVADP